MKGNNGTGNTIERDEWETPQWLWDELNKQYNFTFDCCANKNNEKCKYFSDSFEKIKYPISNIYEFHNPICWMNPPFSIAEKMFRNFFSVVPKGVAIYRCDNMEKKVWQEVIFPNASWIAIPKGRISYEGFESKGSRFPSALIGLNVDKPKLKGWVTLRIDK